ncbi:MAG: acyltransferase family protein [Chloroflexota bacterium]
MKPRLYFLDNLRAFVIVMVIVLHASITYMVYAPEFWYVLDPDRSVVFTMLVLVVDVPLMPIMFFVAGYFALPSLARRGPSGFIREKVVRLAIPWAFAVVFLAPLATYMTYVSRGVPTGYLQFWTTDFWGPMFQQSVYWFLGVLFALFVLLVWAYAASPRLQATVPRVEQPRPRLFVAFIALTAAGSVLASPYFGLDDWKPISVLFVVQPARIAFYAGYFILGIYAERRGWFTATGFRPDLGPWGWGCVLSGIAYLAFRMGGTPVAVPERAVASLLFATFCLAALIAGVALFQRWVNGAGPAWRTLAANSFGIYYVHPLILYPLAWVLVPVSVPAVVKATLLVVVTLAGSLAVSALVLRRLPGLRRVF